MPESQSTPSTASPDAEREAASAVFAAWLLVAAVAMLFVGLFAAYAIFRIDRPGDFQRDSVMLNTTVGLQIAAGMLGGAIALALGAFALKVGRVGLGRAGLLIALVGGALAFALILNQSISAARHATIVARVSSNPVDGNYLYDGAATWRHDAVDISGTRVLLSPSQRVDLHWMLPQDLPRLANADKDIASGTYTVSLGDIDQHANFFAGRNTFFACYYITALALAAFAAGGMIAALTALFAARRKPHGFVTGLAVYWSFLTVVWIVILRFFYFA